MRTIKIEKRRQWIVVVAVALIMALLAEIFVFMQDSRAVYSDSSVSLFESEGIAVTTVGYEVIDQTYKQNQPEPQIVFQSIDATFDSVLISFPKPIYKPLRVQLYYHAKGEEFTAENATAQMEVPFAAKHMVIPIPKGQYDGLRVDIEGYFALDNIVVSAEPIRVSRVFVRSFNVFHVLVMTALLAGVGLLLLWWAHKPRSLRRLNTLELLVCAACFVYYALWAIDKPLTYPPDEVMRYDVNLFLFEHNRLPVGDELLHPLWGFSYAHFPTVLCNELGYVFMKIASVFLSGDFKLLVAARMVSVCAGTGIVYFLIKISKMLFGCSPARWIPVVFVAFMPQFAFLSSYVNNDSLALLGAAMMLYAWTLAIRYNWEWRSAVLLAVGVSVCGLSYYNSYSWILMSIFFFVFTYWYQNRKDYKGLAKMFGFIVAIVVVLVAYSFVRHVVLYGDLLGFNTRRYYGEVFATDWLKPSNAREYSPKNAGITFGQMLYDAPYEYMERTWDSFVGVFGAMNVFCDDIVYDIVLWIVVIGALGLVWKLVGAIRKKECPKLLNVVLWIAMIASGVISIYLAVSKSYTGDFQPQGRYCYPAILPIALLIGKGYETWIDLFKRREHRYAITAAGCVAFISLSLYVFKIVYLPS